MRKWLLIFLPLAVQAQVGEITELRGIGEVVRQDTTDSLTAELELSISSYDDVRTGNGRMAIEFLDSSVLSLTEHSKVVIDSYIFDPDPDKSRLALNMASGTARFLTGALGRINKENIAIRTPTASIFIRGTDFTTTVDEIGRSLIILLPNEDGSSSGEITVETAASTVVLNQPFQATMTTVAESAPTRPVVLTGLTLGFIDNLLIISPRDEITEVVEEQSGTASNILDVDLLEETELDDNELENDELKEEIGRLDIDLLNIDFLTDLLEIIEVSVTEQAEAEQIAGVQIEGIIPGFDPQNQIYSFVEGEVLTIFRSVENTVDLELDKEGSYNIALLSAGKAIDITVNGGGDNAISITQSN
jgi:hypothetical protein